MQMRMAKFHSWGIWWNCPRKGKVQHCNKVQFLCLFKFFILFFSILSFFVAKINLSCESGIYIYFLIWVKIKNTTWSFLNFVGNEVTKRQWESDQERPDKQEWLNSFRALLLFSYVWCFLFGWVGFFKLGRNQNETAMLIQSVIVVVHNFRFFP